MTPKEAYEARKAERKARLSGNRSSGATAAEKDAEMSDMFDRFVTAIERIADALEKEVDARHV